LGEDRLTEGGKGEKGEKKGKKGKKGKKEKKKRRKNSPFLYGTKPRHQPKHAFVRLGGCVQT